MPSVKPEGDNVESQTTDGGTLVIYSVPTLNASCYGPVTAIEYCYRYNNSAGSDQCMFKWTVLLLEDNGKNFMISDTYIIESHLTISNSANCHMTNNREQVTCCDRTDINLSDRFNLSANFVFGVTQSVQENYTTGATLLGFHESEYGVPNVVVINRAEVPDLSVGVTVRNGPPMPRLGIRMLWFVIGKHCK